MKQFIYRNSLSIVFLAFALASLMGQAWTGWKEHNDFLKEHSQHMIPFAHYLTTGHFIQATFENWESEFFQMMFFVVLTIFLKQKGSSESKSEEDDESKKDELVPKRGSPKWLKAGGWKAFIYPYSLTLALAFLFALSFVMHWYGSWKDDCTERILNGEATRSFSSIIASSKFWFESFQNWQSEFLSIFAIIYLSIYLRQKGSPQSKPVNAPHSQTGE